MMMNMRDDWVAAALSDDALVADLLSRLNHSPSQPPKPPPSASFSFSFSLPGLWGHRQPRSKPKKDSAATAAPSRSPTTPLSWSGGGGAASPSDGDYSNSNSSRLSSDLSRSKGVYTTTNDFTNIYANKRSKKRKTFAELKEEESLLLEERATIERELASVHVTLEEQRVTSENLKRIKIDLNLKTTGERCGASSHTEVVFPNTGNQMEASTSDHTRSDLPRRPAAHEGFGSSSSWMPSEEDIGPEVVSSMS